MLGKIIVKEINFHQVLPLPHHDCQSWKYYRYDAHFFSFCGFKYKDLSSEKPRFMSATVIKLPVSRS